MDGAVASWVPAPILVGVLALALGALYALLKREFSRLDKTLEKIDTRLGKLEESRPDLVTREMLERVVGRANDQIMDLRERVRVLEKK